MNYIKENKEMLFMYSLVFILTLIFFATFMYMNVNI